MIFTSDLSNVSCPAGVLGFGTPFELYARRTAVLRDLGVLGDPLSSWSNTAPCIDRVSLLERRLRPTKVPDMTP
jgi:hypothetical protein